MLPYALAAAWALPCAWKDKLMSEVQQKNLSASDLQALLDAGLIDQTLKEKIAAFLETRQGERLQPRFDLTHVLWYLGALIIIAAMGLFTNDAFNRMGGWALAACGAAYAVIAFAGGDYLWTKKSLRIPGGLLIAVAISMVPMIVYGVQDALDLWKYAQGDPGTYHNFYPYINGSWIYMELATILAACLAAYFYRFPFILLIAAVALWFMSMDLAMWFTQSPQSYAEFDVRRTVSIIFGLATIAISWAMDLKRRGGADMSFWLHIAGALAFWGGLSLHDGGTGLEKFIYLMINITLLGFSLFMNRRVYAIFGGFGIAIYLGDLAFNVFNDVLGFAFALSAIGILIIYLGLLLHRNRDRLVAKMDANLPIVLKRLKPPTV